MSIPIYTSKHMQEWDKFTVEHEPISSVDLMDRAAALASEVILARNQFESVTIFCGPGNNGGDGLVIARLLAQAKKKVNLILFQFGIESAEFRTNYKKLPKGISITKLSTSNYIFNDHSDLVIDAIFGSGLDRPIDGWISRVIGAINEIPARKIAIDLPSGLYANGNESNSSFPSVFKADETLTFMSPKMAFFFSSYAAYVGKFRIIDIGLHPDFKKEVWAYYMSSSEIHLKKPGKFDHKGLKGFLTLIGGLGEMSGAIIIASRAAMKSGVGYVNTVSHPLAQTPLNTSVPEVIWQNAEKFKLVNKTTAIAIGPGLGSTKLSTKLLKKAFQSALPLVLDADAINLLSADAALLDLLPKDTILTPHLRELKRLIGDEDSEEQLLQKQRIFSKDYGVFIVQKGPFSKLSTPNGELYINSTGNPGMAIAGMGDALTGLIGSLLAQGYASIDAAKYGMFLHGYAADEYAKNVGEIGLLPTDVIAELPIVMNRFVRT